MTFKHNSFKRNIFIFRILQSCKHLRFLDVSFCRDIDFSVVSMWKKEYPHVAIKKSYQNT